MEPVTLKMATFFVSPEDIRQIYTEKWAAAITEATDGLIQWEHYPAAQLGGLREIPDSMQAGIIDASTWLAPSNVSEDFPFLAAMSVIVFGWPDVYETFNAVHSASYDLLAEPYATKNIKHFWTMDGSYGQEWFMADPFDEDDITAGFKGKSLRAAGGLQMSALIKYLGAEHILMPSSEVYEAAQKGIINGCDQGFAQYVGARTYEVFPHVMFAKNTFSYYGGGQAGMTLSLYESFPEDIQDAIVSLSADIQEDFWYDYREHVNSNRDRLIEEGAIKQYIELDEETKAEWKKDMALIIDDIMMAEFPDDWPIVRAILDEHAR
jgi:TRAP-type C4-dicarboxylate transport system substrate-binding protein